MTEFTLLHVGINCANADESKDLADLLSLVFNLKAKPGNSSNFAGTYFEMMKKPGRGRNGHVAMGAADVDAAVAELKEKGFGFDDTSATYTEDGKLKNIYMDREFGGFAIHILRKA